MGGTGGMISSLSSDAHQVAIYLGCVLAGTLILLVIRLLWRSGVAIRALESHVLPHFLPPSPEEIRSGSVDNSLPGRIERQELNLARHLSDEETAAAELNGQLAEIRESLSRLNEK
jgi:hypothetical protein